MDQEWLPKSLRDTLRDILECGNSRPFRGYYDWVTDEVLRVAQETGCTQIAELGAGTAPITRHLMKEMAANPATWSLTLAPCDLNPDEALYKKLQEEGQGYVKPQVKPVDFEKPYPWEPKTLTVLSATLHHLPEPRRTRALKTLSKSAEQVLVFEPLRNSTLSLLFCFLSLIPALLTPIVFARRPNAARRFVWCWLLPIAPPMFVWDGLVSCLRQSDPARRSTRRGPARIEPSYAGIFCHSWARSTR
jgi:hypothetical protein